MPTTLNWSHKRLIDDRAYNLFRNPKRPAIFCAVPEDYPVPCFLDGWEYEGSLRAGAPLPSGFDRQAARVGVRFNGFYLFQIITEPQRRKTVVAAGAPEKPPAPRGFGPPRDRLNDNGIVLAEVG